MGLSLAARIVAHIEVDPDTGCWLWTLSKRKNGYGQIRVNRKTLLVHRVAFEMFRGPIPEGHDIDHVYESGCRNRHCLNWVEHLEAVTHAENLRRKSARITHCPQLHDYTPANTYVGASGKRQCRACKVRWR